jgi:hypothetical protein
LPKLNWPNAKCRNSYIMPKLPKRRNDETAETAETAETIGTGFGAVSAQYVLIFWYSFGKFRHNCANKLNLVESNKKKKQKENVRTFLRKKKIKEKKNYTNPSAFLLETHRNRQNFVIEPFLKQFLKKKRSIKEKIK